MKDLPFNEHLPLIDDVIALVLVAGVTKTGQHLSAFRFPQQSSAGIISAQHAGITVFLICLFHGAPFSQNQFGQQK